VRVKLLKFVIAKAKAKIIESKRGNKILLLNNFKFFIGLVNPSDKNIRWRCIKKSCSAKVYTDDKYEYEVLSC